MNYGYIAFVEDVHCRTGSSPDRTWNLDRDVGLKPHRPGSVVDAADELASAQRTAPTIVTCVLLVLVPRSAEEAVWKAAR